MAIAPLCSRRSFVSARNYALYVMAQLYVVHASFTGRVAQYNFVITSQQQQGRTGYSRTTVMVLHYCCTAGFFRELLPNTAHYVAGC